MMSDESILPSIKHKLVLLGDQSVGKTSIITRFMYDTFENQYQATIGIDFFSKTITLPTHLVRLHLWDTAGQERFHSLIPSYIRNSAATIIVYDVASRQSFIHTFRWIDEVRAERGDDVIIMLCGNKNDISAEQRQVSREEASSKAAEYKVEFMEVSAKNGENIKALFRKVAELLPSPVIREDSSHTTEINKINNSSLSNNNQNSQSRSVNLVQNDPLLITPSSNKINCEQMQQQQQQNQINSGNANPDANNNISNKFGCCAL